MNITHIIVGDEAAKPLQEAIALDENLQGNIIVLKDTLGIGPIFVNEGESFTNIRTAFWKGLITTWPEEQIVEDEKNIITLVENLQDDGQVWFWMAPNVSDVCAYFWLLNFFKNHNGILHTIFINSLPFFNSKGALFYPKNFSEVLPKEIVKCRKLLKDVSVADYEMDGDDWTRLAGENALVRSYDGGKKVNSKNDTYFDAYFLNQFQFSNEFVKASKVLSQAINKVTENVSDLFLQFILRKLIRDEKLQVNGDANKGLNSFEVRKNTELNLQ